MKRRFLAILTSLLLLLMVPLTVSAEELSLVIDNAGLLTDEEIQDLSVKAAALRNQYQTDVVILIEGSLDGELPQDYAEDCLIWQDYGYGDDYNAILLLLSMEERDWCITTSGEAIFVLTDYGKQASMEEALSYFGNDDFYNGFQVWLDGLPVYFDAFYNGEPIDGYADYSGDYYHGVRDEIVYYEEPVTPSFFLSLIIGLIAASVSVLIMRFSMNSKRPQGDAANYLIQGSYHLRKEKDVFLYSNVQKTPRQTESSSSSRGGGSSVRTHSSGRKFSSGGGKF